MPATLQNSSLTSSTRTTKTPDTLNLSGLKSQEGLGVGKLRFRVCSKNRACSKKGLGLGKFRFRVYILKWPRQLFRLGAAAWESLSGGCHDCRTGVVPSNHPQNLGLSLRIRLHLHFALLHTALKPLALNESPLFLVRADYCQRFQELHRRLVSACCSTTTTTSTAIYCGNF